MKMKSCDRQIWGVLQGGINSLTFIAFAVVSVLSFGNARYRGKVWRDPLRHCLRVCGTMLLERGVCKRINLNLGVRLKYQTYPSAAVWGWRCYRGCRPVAGIRKRHVAIFLRDCDMSLSRERFCFSIEGMSLSAIERRIIHIWNWDFCKIFFLPSDLLRSPSNRGIGGHFFSYNNISEITRFLK